MLTNGPGTGGEKNTLSLPAEKGILTNEVGGMGPSPKGSQWEGLVTWIGCIYFRLSLLPRFQGKRDDASSP
jgi:hypothetical protein